MTLRLKLRWFLLLILVAIIGIVGYYAYSLLHFANKISNSKDSPFSQFQSPSAQKPVVEVYEPPKWEGRERVNILLMGGDSRGLKPNEVPRSDSIMVASIDPVTKKAVLFSILRDTYVNIPSHGRDRINAALALGGPELAMKTVSDFTGLPIQYYVYTDFKGFIALIDAIGGIDYEVEKDMKWSDSEDDHIYDIDLKKGWQHLDGKTALQYVRFRHDALSDFTRTERQRNFLKAVAQKLQSTTSLVKLPHILSEIDPYIQTNLTITEMLKLGTLGFDVKAQGVEGIQLPPSNLLEEERAGGASVLGANPVKVRQFVEDTLNGTGGNSAVDDKSGPAPASPSSRPASGREDLVENSGSGSKASTSSRFSSRPGGTQSGGTHPPRQNEAVTTDSYGTQDRQGPPSRAM